MREKTDDNFGESERERKFDSLGARKLFIPVKDEKLVVSVDKRQIASI